MEDLEHEKLSEDINQNLSTLHSELTETQEAVEEAHSNLEDDDDMKEFKQNL